MASENETLAQTAINKAKEYGFSIRVHGATVTVHKQFTPGDKDAYCKAEGEANDILDIIPMKTAGSIWGTDGASIGGHVGLTNGYMTLNKSGCGKRVLNAIHKINA
jgi:hypothetical protein